MTSKETLTTLIKHCEACLLTEQKNQSFIEWNNIEAIVKSNDTIVFLEDEIQRYKKELLAT